MRFKQIDFRIIIQPPKIHEFQEDLEWSEVPAQYLIYMKSIVHWWPEANGWMRILDLLKQKSGNDVIIYLPNEEEIRIQFKSRRSRYDDLCIEYRHDYHNGYSKPGWVEIPSEAHYLLYIVPEGTTGPACVYRIDYQSLHVAWDLNKEEWLSSQSYFHPDAQNEQYITRNIAIPWHILDSVGVIVDRFILSG